MKNYTLTEAISTMTEIATNPSPLVASLFTAEDVLNILKSIKPTGIQEDWKEGMKDMISRMIRDDFSQMADYDEFRLEINYGREVEVSDIGCDRRAIAESVSYLVEGEMSEFFGELEHEDNEDNDNKKTEDNEVVQD